MNSKTYLSTLHTGGIPTKRTLTVGSQRRQVVAGIRFDVTIAEIRAALQPLADVYRSPALGEKPPVANARVMSQTEFSRAATSLLRAAGLLVVPDFHCPHCDQPIERSVLASALASSSETSGRPKVEKPCPKCGQMFGARELRAHLPKCIQAP